MRLVHVVEVVLIIRLARTSAFSRQEINMTTTDERNSNISELPKQSAVSLLEDQFVNMKFITQLTTLSDKWFYKLIQDGEFPKPIKFGRRSLWLKSEVEQWLMQKIEESREEVSA